MTPAQTATARKIIAEHLGHEGLDEIVDSARLVVLGADSLDTVEIVMTLEEAFGIHIDDAEVPDDPTVGDVFALLGRKLT